MIMIKNKTELSELFFFFSIECTHPHFNKLKALALDLGVQSQQCAQFHQHKISVGAVECLGPG